MAIPILRIPVVLRLRGRSRSGHYLDIQQGLFPHPVKIGPRAAGHPENEVEVMNNARIAGKSDEEIRALVLTLEAARKQVSGGGVA